MASELIAYSKKRPQGRRLFSVAAETASDLASAVAAYSKGHFVLFLAWDARSASDQEIRDLARQFVRAGLAYIVAWGPDCERVHDLFDDVDIELNPESNSPDGETVIMSTWHDKEPLEQALWFSLHSAQPASPYDQTCSATIAAAVANAEWSALIRGYLSNPSSLDQAVGL